MLNKKELSESLKVSVASIDRAMVQGMPYLKIGGSVRFDYKEVIDWANSKQEKKEV